MTNFFNNLKLRFNSKDILIRLILINVFVFLAVNIVIVVSTLFKLGIADTFLGWIAVSANTDVLIRHIWTVFTYMFVHQQILHILFNMLVLYWFGRIFLTYFNNKALVNLYLLGGLSGALLYVLAFNTIPYYIDMNYPPMIGASASVTAILFASAFYNPEQRINLFILGSVKIIYIALFIFIIDFVSLAGNTNPGGSVAHIGGAVLGYIYAVQYRKGRNIVGWLNKPLDAIANLFKPKPVKMKVKFNKREADYEYNKRRRNQTEDIDRILDKIKASGYSSLSSDEKKKLFDASKK